MDLPTKYSPFRQCFILFKGLNLTKLLTTLTRFLLNKRHSRIEKVVWEVNKVGRLLHNELMILVPHMHRTRNKLCTYRHYSIKAIGTKFTVNLSLVLNYLIISRCQLIPILGKAAPTKYTHICNIIWCNC